MRTATNLMKVLHKQIITIFSSEVLQKAGELTEGWDRESNNHIQHTSDILRSKRLILQRQIENTDFLKEEPEQLRSFYNMLVKDIKNLTFNIQSDKLPDGLIQEAESYLQDMKDMVDALKAVLE